MRLLHAARLSRLGDAATGIEKQDESARRYAEARGDEIVATAADTDVSGSVSPWERPELGPWLARAGEYDGIIASHLDRLGRNVRQLTDLHRWAEDNHVALITVEPAMDWSSPVGRLIWQIMAWLAEQELAAITRRNIETQKWLRSNGYLVGRAPFGYLAAESGEHKILVPDPATAPLVRTVATRYASGEPLTSLAVWLTEVAPRPRGNVWRPNGVADMLQNPVYRGRRADGLKVPRIFSPELAAAIGAEAERRKPSPRSVPGADAALLQGIIRCGLCGGPMYRHVSRNDRGFECWYYRCRGTSVAPSKCRNSIRMEAAEAEIEEMIEQLGDIPHTEPKYIQAEGNADAIAQVDADLSALDQDAPDYDERHAELRAQRAALRAAKPRPARTEWVDTGEGIRQVWARLDTTGRRRWLADRGFVVTVADKQPVITREGNWPLRLTGQPQRRAASS